MTTPSPRWPLALILLVALALRLHGVTFGLPALYDPDELMFEMGSVRMLSQQTLNPGWFGHPGTTTIYLLSLINTSVFLAGWLTGWFADARAFADAIYTNPGLVMLPARIVMALFGVLCVFLTERLATALVDRRAGLAAAALMAVNPIHVFWSQVIRTDIMATAFLLTSLLHAVRIARNGARLRDVVLGSLWLALAVATKWPFALGLFALLGALALPVAEGRLSPSTAARRGALVLVLTPALLFLVSPYLLLTPDAVLRDLMGESQVHHLGATGSGPTGNAWWYLSGPVLAGLGIAGLALAVVGMGLLRRHRVALAVLAPLLVSFFGVICVQNLVWERWALPLMPLLACCAALGLNAVVDLARRHKGPVPIEALNAVLLAAVAIVPLDSALARNRERLDDTRQQASAWARAHIPAGSRVMIEHFAFDLQAEPWRFYFPMGDVGCVDARAMLSGKIKYDTVGSARGRRSNVDYGTMAPARRADCAVDYAIVTQYDRYAAERGTFPAEYAAYESLIASGRIVATFRPVPAHTGGPVTRIVEVGPAPAPEL